MRGKDKSLNISVDDWGITPAHAGKRGSGETTTTDEKDHPRTCGEKLFTTKTLFCNKGSPPHMRGKVVKSIDDTL